MPHSKLYNWVSNYTIAFPNRKTISDNYTVIPHGSATLVFSYDGKDIYSNLFGPITKPFIIGEQANEFKMLFIVEFQPAGLSVLTGVKQKDLADQTIAFELISPELNKLIVEILNKADNIEELIINIDKVILSNLDPSELSIAIEKIIENMGNISTKELNLFNS